MAIAETRYEHIVLDDAGVPLIDGTTLKLIELVVAQQAYGWSPEELAFQFPHLTLGQIYSALAYYWDHRQDLDDEIARRLALVDMLQSTTPPAPALAKVQAHRSG